MTRASREKTRSRSVPEHKPRPLASLIVVRGTYSSKVAARHKQLRKQTNQRAHSHRLSEARAPVTPLTPSRPWPVTHNQRNPSLLLYLISTRTGIPVRSVTICFHDGYAGRRAGFTVTLFWQIGGGSLGIASNIGLIGVRSIISHTFFHCGYLVGFSALYGCCHLLALFEGLRYSLRHVRGSVSFAGSLFRIYGLVG